MMKRSRVRPLRDQRYVVVAEAEVDGASSRLSCRRPGRSCRVGGIRKVHDFVGTRVIVLRCIGTAGRDVALNTDSAGLLAARPWRDRRPVTGRESRRSIAADQGRGACGRMLRDVSPSETDASRGKPGLCHRPPATPPARPRRDAGNELQTAAAVRIAVSGTQLRHPRGAAAASDLHPGNAVSSSDRDGIARKPRAGGTAGCCRIARSRAARRQHRTGSPGRSPRL